MTNYKIDRPKQKSLEKEKLFNKLKKHTHSEKETTISKELEEDRVVQVYSEYINSFKPPINCLEPSSFSHYGSAEQYYKDSIYSIINYYPFDGTLQETLSWFVSSSHLDASLLQQEWPTSVGSINFNYSEYIFAYSGPQAIAQSEFIGDFVNKETGLKVDLLKGNTIEFWFKKDAVGTGAKSETQETIFEIATYPSALPAASEAKFRVYFTESDTEANERPECLFMDFASGAFSDTGFPLAGPSITSEIVADGKWHHYALQVSRPNANYIDTRLYIDGQPQDTLRHLSEVIYNPFDSHMAITIGSTVANPSGSLSGSIDDFRFWKGIRTSKEITKFYDKKIYASNRTKSNYSSSLGLLYTFNQPSIGVEAQDTIVLDYSGNDILGRIKNYKDSTRLQTSAINLSTVTSNSEIEEPILKEAHQKVIDLRERLIKIGKSYDYSNFNMMKRMYPDWAQSGQYGFEQSDHLGFLTQLMSSVFDDVKVKLDSIRDNTAPQYTNSRNAIYGNNFTVNQESSLERENQDKEYEILDGHSTANKIDFSKKIIENTGIYSGEYDLLWDAKIEEVIQSIIGNVTMNNNVHEIRNLLYDCLANAVVHIQNRKGTESSFRTILNAIGLGNDLIHSNILGQHADLFLEDEKKNYVSKNLKSISFFKNNDAVLHQTSAHTNHKSYIPLDNQETEYTFEGNFVFPLKTKQFYEVQDSSIFGIEQVSGVNNDLTISDPSNASFSVSVVKPSVYSNDAKFVVSSDASLITNIETDIIPDVYGGAPWNLSLKITKNQDNNFVEAPLENYKVEFSGYSHISDLLMNSFHLTRSLATSNYNNFKAANKTVYIGAKRNNITGSTVQKKTDIKFLNFNSWNAALSEEELKTRSMTLTSFGSNRVHLFDDLESTKNNSLKDSLFMKIQIEDLEEVSSTVNNAYTLIKDEVSGSQISRDFYGDLRGHSYPFSPAGFTTDSEDSLVSEYFPVVEFVQTPFVHGTAGVQVKDREKELEKQGSKSEIKIASFEKSLYQSISKDMVDFISGLKSLNNLIGEPVNKYRLNYKLLSNLKSKFFFNVKDEVDFERYVAYYRWIDKSVGNFLEQMVPGSMAVNAGIENVVESHILERNKIQHKLPRLKNTRIDLLGIARSLAASASASPSEAQDAENNAGHPWSAQNNIGSVGAVVGAIVETIVTGSTAESQWATKIGNSSIASIENVRTFNPVGNYDFDYEIVTTFLDSHDEDVIFTGSLVQSSTSTGFLDYEIQKDKGRKHLIASRFSSVGSAPGSSTHMFVRPNSEFSVYETINNKNYTGRQFLNYFSQEHSDKFGLRPVSGAHGKYLPSFHAVHRNTRYHPIESQDKKYDNLFVQNHIPQSDFSYSWITNSAGNTVYDFLQKNGNIPHQHNFEISGNLKSSESIQFIQSVDVKDNLDFSSLNFFNSKSLNVETNTITNSAVSLNSVILNNNGPYGFPSWKQIRGYENSVIKAHREQNTYSVVFRGDSANASPYPGVYFDYQNTKEDHRAKTVDREIRNYFEIPVTSRFSPLVFTIQPISSEQIYNAASSTGKNISNQQYYKMLWDSDFAGSSDLYEFSIPAMQVNVRATIQNNITSYSNEQLIEETSFNETPFLESKDLQDLNFFIKQTATTSNEQGYQRYELGYTEKIYPREMNTYKQETRSRINFSFFGWNSKPENRVNIMSGNILFGSPMFEQTKMFPKLTILNQEKDSEKSYFNLYDAVDINNFNDSHDLTKITHITHSTWPLESRANFGNTPIDIKDSFYNNTSSFMNSRSQGTRGEGILQNDYSLYPLGMNGLFGAPPLAPIYSRRVVQNYENSSYLAGEAKWEAADSHEVGPFYDSYREYSKDIEVLGQSYSLISEFTISKYVDDLLINQDPEKLTENMQDFLEVTGALKSNSSEDIAVGSQFFKTYSNTEFLKYFKPIQENNTLNGFDLEPTKLTLKCCAVKRFLPYRGFYPAERVVQLSQIFNKNYLPSGSYQTELVTNNTFISSSSEIEDLITLRIQNSKTQALRPIMAPGVLLNSIKAGIATDYPLFSSSVDTALNKIKQNSDENNMISNFSLFGTASMCFTGSLLNSSLDAGVPRISGSVSRRISFTDIINPERIYGEVLYDNEPHPSSSMLYGSDFHFPILERPTKFGTLDEQQTRTNTGIRFKATESEFSNKFLPFKSAVQNFTSETVNFFLQDGKLSTIMSKPVIPKLTAGKQYKMYVHLENTGISMYDRHSSFGPAVDAGQTEFTKYSYSSSVSQEAAAATGSIDFSSATEFGVDDNTITIKNSSNLEKTYIFKDGFDPSGAVAASGSLQLTGGYSSASDLDEINFTIKATNSIELTYEFRSDSSDPPSTHQSGFKYVININSMNTANILNEIKTVVETVHSGAILVSTDVSNNKVVFTQNNIGTSGNHTIFKEGSLQSNISLVGFSGGTEGTEYVHGSSDGSGRIIVPTEGLMTSGVNIGKRFISILTSSQGHSNTIEASINTSSALVSMTQSAASAAGNNEISFSGFSGTISGFGGGLDAQVTTSRFLDSETQVNSASHGYLPYVPPFLDPKTSPYAEITFVPENTDNYNVKEIIEGSTITYYNIEQPNNSSTNTNYLNAMDLRASLSLDKYVRLKSDNFKIESTSAGLQEIPIDNVSRYRWVIQSLWETPVLDFSNVNSSVLNLQTSEVDIVKSSPYKTRYQDNYYNVQHSSSVPYLTSSRGMWHQKGELIEHGSEKGYVLGVSGPYVQDNNDSIGNLAVELGFAPAESKKAKTARNIRYSKTKIGKISKNKNISEAVVAIPYYTDASGNIILFKISQDMFSRAKVFNNNREINFRSNFVGAKNDYLSSLRLVKDYENFYSDTGQSVVANLAYQLRMLDKYILPPHFDFIRNKNVDPHVQYIFQFNANLTEKDLSDMWQNLYPSSKTGAATAQHSRIFLNAQDKEQKRKDEDLDTEYITSNINIQDAMASFSTYEKPETFMNEKVRWIVFKSKFRGTSNYEKLVNKSISVLEGDVLVEEETESIKSPASAFFFNNYGYNWPYDYFSIVELAEVNAKVNFSQKTSSPTAEIDSEEEVSLEGYTFTPGQSSTAIPQSIISDTRQSDFVNRNFITTISSGSIDQITLRKTLKNFSDPVPSPANQITVALPDEYILKPGAESIYVNGVLQTPGSNNDYVVSNNTITFGYSIDTTDIVQISYIMVNE